MSALVETAVTNALMATSLAAIVWLVARWSKRPALVHFLWLVVLLRLFAPPIWTVPWIPAKSADPPATIAALPEWAGGLEGTGSLASVESHVIEDAAAARSTPDADPALVLSWCWGAGSLVVLLLGLIRIRRFQKLLGHARVAPPELQATAQHLATRLGLRRAPPILLVPAGTPPLVWGFFRRAHILLPAALVQNVDTEELHGLLAHELAHVRRRDHWIRYLELLAFVTYWWLPVTWWASRRLREAEESCCDAWAVWLAPTAREAYASALLRTVSFLAETRTRAPSPAVGMGAVHGVKRRLGMILDARPHGTPALRARWILALVAASPLLFVPVRAQGPPPGVKPAIEVPEWTEVKAKNEGPWHVLLTDDPVVRIYEVRDLSVDVKDLARLIKDNVEPKSWKKRGHSIRASKGVLVVMTTPGIHRHIDHFLNDLRQCLRPKQRKDDPEVVSPRTQRDDAVRRAALGDHAALRRQIAEAKAAVKKLADEIARLERHERKTQPPRAKDRKLEGRCELHIVVTDRRGQPVQGVGVFAVRRNSETGPGIDADGQGPVSDTRGRLKLDGLEAGPHRVHFMKGSSLVGTVAVELKAGTQVKTHFVVDGEGKLRDR